MDPKPLALPRVQKLFTHFNIATLANPGTVLARDMSGTAVHALGAEPYGQVPHAAIGVSDGKIAWIMPHGQLPSISEDVEVIHGHGQLMTPGFIDSHTHLVYGGDRAGEWEQRLRGTSYTEIAKGGGGIMATVRATRAASEQELFDLAAERAQRLMAEGVTTLEIKSGYGLDTETELKMLRVARRIGEALDVQVVTTLLAAHAIPPEYAGRSDDYIDLICREILPLAAKENLCDAVDAFCETIAFSREQTIRVFDSAHKLGLPIKVHAEQLSRQGIAVEAARRGALSVDHLEYLSEADCEELGRSSTVANLLPGAFYCLRESQLPPVDALRRNGVRMGVATDWNPGSSPLASLLLAGNLACNLFGLTPEEAIRGMTLHAAHALGLQDSRGSLEPGKDAVFATFRASTPASLLYTIGGNPNTERYLL